MERPASEIEFAQLALQDAYSKSLERYATQIDVDVVDSTLEFTAKADLLSEDKIFGALSAAIQDKNLRRSGAVGFMAEHPAMIEAFMSRPDAGKLISDLGKNQESALAQALVTRYGETYMRTEAAGIGFAPERIRSEFSLSIIEDHPEFMATTCAGIAIGRVIKNPSESNWHNMRTRVHQLCYDYGDAFMPTEYSGLAISAMTRWGMSQEALGLVLAHEPFFCRTLAANLALCSFMANRQFCGDITGIIERNIHELAASKDTNGINSVIRYLREIGGMDGLQHGLIVRFRDAAQVLRPS